MSEITTIVVIPVIMDHGKNIELVQDCLAEEFVQVYLFNNSGKELNITKKFLGHERVRIINFVINLNWLHSNNIGAAMAIDRPHIRYVCFLNDDVKLSQWFFGNMIKVYEAEPKARLVVPTYNGIFGQPQVKATGHQQPRVRARYVDGTCMFLSRDSIYDIGLLDPCFSGLGWGADVDYSHRVNQHHEIWIATKSHLMHHSVVGALSAKKIHGPTRWLKMGLAQAKRDLEIKYGINWRQILPIPQNAYDV